MRNASSKRRPAAGVDERQRYLRGGADPVDHFVERNAVPPERPFGRRVQTGRGRHEIVALAEAVVQSEAVAGEIEQHDIGSVFALGEVGQRLVHRVEIDVLELGDFEAGPPEALADEVGIEGRIDQSGVPIRRCRSPGRRGGRDWQRDSARPHVPTPQLLKQHDVV